MVWACVPNAAESLNMLFNIYKSLFYTCLIDEILLLVYGVCVNMGLFTHFGFIVKPPPPHCSLRPYKSMGQHVNGICSVLQALFVKGNDSSQFLTKWETEIRLYSMVMAL